MVNFFEKYFTTYKGLHSAIYALFVARTISVLGSFIFPLMSIILARKFNYTEMEVAKSLSIISAVVIPALFVGTPIANKVDRKRFIVITTYITGLIFIFVGMNFGENVFIFGMGLIMALEAIRRPCSDSIIADVTTADDRQKAFSLIYLGINIGASLSPIIGGFMLENHLIAMFYLNGLATIISSTLILLYVHPKENVATAEVVGLDIPEDEAEKASSSIFDVFKNNKLVIFFLVITGLFSFIYLQYWYTLPLFMTDIFQANGAKYYGFIMSANAITVVLITPYITSLATEKGLVNVMAFTPIFFFIGLVLFPSCSTLLPFIFLSVIFTIGEVTLFTNTSATLSSMATASQRGTIFGAYQITSEFVRIGGVALTGAIITATSIHTIWYVVAGVQIVTAVLLLNFRKKYNARDIIN